MFDLASPVSVPLRPETTSRLSAVTGRRRRARAALAAAGPDLAARARGDAADETAVPMECAVRLQARGPAQGHRTRQLTPGDADASGRSRRVHRDRRGRVYA